MTRRLLPEWHVQSGIMVAWPHDAAVWGPAHAEVQSECLELISAVSRYEKVMLIVPDAQSAEPVLAQLREREANTERVETAVAPCNDVWIRDYGPLSVAADDGLRLVDFRFNGWGDKFPHDLDDAVSSRLHGAGLFKGLELETLDVVLEGGAVDTDGEGTLLATPRSVLDPRRNAGVDRTAMEAILHRSLGIDRVLWLDVAGLLGDDTDGHVDTLARFADADTIVYSTCVDPGDPNYSRLQSLEEALRGLTKRDGRPFHLVPLPLPKPLFDDTGRRLPANYLNYLVINDALCVPCYDVPQDTPAATILGRNFPGRTVIPLRARGLVHQNGSIHCATLQIARGVL